MELLYGAIFLDKPLNPITKLFYTDSHLYFYVLVKELIIFLSKV